MSNHPRNSRCTAATHNYWPAVADMILAAFMIVLLLWFGGNVINFLTQKQLSQNADQVERLKSGLGELVERIDRLLAEKAKVKEQLLAADGIRKRAEELDKLLSQLQAQITQLETIINDLTTRNTKLTTENSDLSGKLHNKPPNIILSEAENYTFELGSAAVTENFRERLNSDLGPKLLDTFDKYPVEIIEIVGHTDTKPANGTSNLDSLLLKAIDGTAPLKDLKFGSNADLGLMRAVAVRQLLWQYFQGRIATPGLPQDQKARLNSVQIRTYSAAQTVPSEENGQEIRSAKASDVGGVTADRRIEIRFTRLKD